MDRSLPGSSRSVISALLLSLIAVVVLFRWQSHFGLSFYDEGALWYGAQRVLAGEVPIRDFLAYDFGRYYWSAAFMILLGDSGIVALRVASAVFQALGLATGLVLLAPGPANPSRLFWALAAITLVVWGAPPYRLFDISLPIILIGALSFLAEQPSRRRYFLTGTIVGLAAVFGRNHGLYGALGGFGLMLYLAARRESGPRLPSAFLAAALGVVAGYLPVLVFLAVVPGYARAFWESIRVLFEMKATNGPLPVPWPWRVPFGQVPIGNAIRGAAEGTFFMAIAVFGALGLVWVIRKKLRNEPVSPPLLASVFLAPPYVHFAYSRADIEHLAPGIPPFLIGALALLAGRSGKIKWPLAVLLCGASLAVMLPLHAGWYCRMSGRCVEVEVAADTLAVDRSTANTLGALRTLAARYAPGERTFIVAPLWPGAYAALGRKSPLWEIYAIIPRSVGFQQAEIQRIKDADPGFAVIFDFPLDGRDELRFRNTNPLVERYIRENFTPLDGFSRNPAIQVYVDGPAGRERQEPASVDPVPAERSRPLRPSG